MSVTPIEHSSQKPMLRPLTQLDNQVLDSVYGCYVVNKPGETFNVEALFSVVADIMGPSIGLADPSIKVCIYTFSSSSLSLSHIDLDYVLKEIKMRCN